MKRCKTCGALGKRIVLGLCGHCYRLVRPRLRNPAWTCAKCGVQVSTRRSKFCRTCYVGYKGAKPVPKCLDCGVTVSGRKQKRCHACNGKHRSGPRNPHWKGGRCDFLGYMTVLVNGKQKLEHRHVMEQQLGRKLLPKETVHHINGDRKDNSPENLELWTSGHPVGVRVRDEILYCIGFLEVHAPELLNHEALHDQGAVERLIEGKAPNDAEV